MKYTKYLTAVVALFIATACAMTDLDEQSVVVGGNHKGDQIKVVGRVTRFDEHDVATRGAKDSKESQVTCMSLALFEVTNNDTGELGPCISYYYAEGSDPLFTITRDNLGDPDPTKRYAFYIFANMPNMDMHYTEVTGENAKGVDWFMEFAHEVTGIDIPTKGFPMIGSLGDYRQGGDGNIFILHPGKTADSPNGLPLVGADEGNLNPSDLLNIPMKSMYSKIVFNINVNPDQELDGMLPPQFTLNGYTVNNVVDSVDFIANTETTSNLGRVLEESFPGVATGNTSSNGPSDVVTFSFYLPERLLTPSTTWNNYQYPFGKGDAIREEDKNLRQRYKPLLLGEGQNATYVTLSGVYRDHQNHEYEVDYDIYLGEDNYGDFNIHRNKQYNNNVTIRGLLNSKDQSEVAGSIAIDHRVNVSRTMPAIINLRRETLLDSHFEVRPLRIRKNDSYGGGNTATEVTVSVLNIDGTENNRPSWIRLERSYGNGATVATSDTYCVGDGSSAGKRKYFTTNLVQGTNSPLAGITSVTVPLSDSNETVWIYVDEALPAEAYTPATGNTAAIGEPFRTALVRVTCGSDTIDYIISQRNLYKVSYTDENNATRTYLIEYHEEYLHNYDADDTFEDNKTEFEGMAWGLDGAQLSHIHRSISFTSGLSGLAANGLTPYYDFYITKHDQANIPNGGTTHAYAGHEFMREIVEYSDSFDNLQLDQTADNAIEYCYNRNRKNANGTIDDIKWYLPSIDEMEDIIIAGYGEFHEFQAKYYWSCQPAYLKHFAIYDAINILGIEDEGGPTYVDNTNYARATKVVLTNNDEDPYDYSLSGLSFDKDTYNRAVSYWLLSSWGGDGKGTWYEPTQDITLGNKPSFAVKLRELADYMQDGYHPRTKKNRIRCVYKQ